MKLAIYRNKSDGKISTHHIMDDISDIETKVAEFNNNLQNNKTVEIVELQEESLEMYLYNRAKFDIQEHKDDLEYMSDQIRDLASSIESLYAKAGVKKDRN